MCGKCCSNLRKGDEKSGLTLFPEELHLFPEEKVRPYIGKGIDRGTDIFAYQQTENICVHLENRKCMIYEQRPMMCRSFPVKVGENGLRFISRCVGVREMIKNSVALTHEMNEVKVAIQLVERLYEFHKSLGEGYRRWRYNLVLEEWLTF